MVQGAHARANVTVTSRFGLEIRGASQADAPDLATLLASANMPITAATLASRLEALRRGPGVVLIAVEWGPPSGVVAATWRRTLCADAPIARLDLLLVDPDARRRGVARALLKATSQAARSAGCDALELTATDEEPTLSAFCGSTGFTLAGPCWTRPLRKHGSSAEPRHDR